MAFSQSVLQTLRNHPLTLSETIEKSSRNLKKVSSTVIVTESKKGRKEGIK